MIDAALFSKGGMAVWFLAITLSLLLHLLLFLELGRWPLIATAPIDQARVTHVRLAFQPSLPEPEPRLESVSEPEPIAEAIAEPEPEPMIEPEPIPAPKSNPEPQSKPIPDPKPKAKPKPTPKTKTEPKPKPETEPKPENKLQAVAPTPAVAQTAPLKRQMAHAAEPLTRDDNAGRKRYLATLLNLIERQKVYPKIARRRDIQGNVQVAFTVACNGTITGLQTHSGHKILQKSALKAVQKALPLPRPPTENPCPVKVKYAMVFKLN